MAKRPIQRNYKYYLEYGYDNNIVLRFKKDIIVEWELGGGVLYLCYWSWPMGDKHAEKIIKSDGDSPLFDKIKIRGIIFYAKELIKQYIQKCIEHEQGVDLFIVEINNHIKDLQAAAQELKNG